jgi:hypothetical protein
VFSYFWDEGLEVGLDALFQVFSFPGGWRVFEGAWGVVNDVSDERGRGGERERGRVGEGAGDCGLQIADCGLGAGNITVLIFFVGERDEVGGDVGGGW